MVPVTDVHLPGGAAAIAYVKCARKHPNCVTFICSSCQGGCKNCSIHLSVVSRSFFVFISNDRYLLWLRPLGSFLTLIRSWTCSLLTFNSHHQAQAHAHIYICCLSPSSKERKVAVSSSSLEWLAAQNLVSVPSDITRRCGVLVLTRALQKPLLSLSAVCVSSKWQKHIQARSLRQETTFRFSVGSVDFMCFQSGPCARSMADNSCAEWHLFIWIYKCCWFKSGNGSQLECVSKVCLKWLQTFIYFKSLRLWGVRSLRLHILTFDPTVLIHILAAFKQLPLWLTAFILPYTLLQRCVGCLSP